jgi:hypothetical protein
LRRQIAYSAGSLDGKVVDWLEKVSDEEYLARLRLRPTRRVECPYHSGGLGWLIDASRTTVKMQLGSPSSS